METKIIRQKLITDFSNFIQDDAKLEVLEGVFDAIKNEENTSIVSDEHYLKVEEEREKYMTSNKTNSWEEVEQQLKTKYGF
ncbi:MAG: hypothetical protein O9267_11120 [Flavobacterium sp.]|jgi:hypothetical protein|uniref:hypothetical protein n=1 Tax=Flavobacterium sp. TaxID=239 RepID=UPI0022C509D3|nr:hypothetical protein [Flavobacterium sp.]MCZ8198147.1 hypothetical protein [Flavobacterium sp.]